MSKETVNGITTFETSQRQLVYDNGFRQMLRKHPGIIRTTAQLIEKAEREYDPGEMQLGLGVIRWNRETTAWQVISYNDRPYPNPQPLDQLVWGRGVVLKAGETQKDPKTGLQVTVLGKSNREFIPLGSSFANRIDISTYAKVSLGENAFFVKKSLVTQNTGFDEFNNSVKAKTALADLDDIKVVEAQLGYVDGKQSWFVSEWEELEPAGFFPADSFRSGSPNDYGEYLDLDSDRRRGLRQRYQLSALIEQRLEQIRKIAQEAGLAIGDLHMNLFYNPSTRRYIYLDVTTPESKRLNQP